MLLMHTHHRPWLVLGYVLEALGWIRVHDKLSRHANESLRTADTSAVGQAMMPWVDTCQQTLVDT